ncbi:hypothetical protein [Rhizobium sp. Root1220]|uniref:hypothetical protein n=1 Tax=Rhizobium sp. Root1220 TaxID=1736432 RepID=UPI000AA8E7E8|nr:hypothetical protein [Rhizobium sp. Root1220]
MISGGMLTNTKMREARITAVITRADGTVEELGTLTYWHRNPLRRLAWRIRQHLIGRKA